MPWASVCGGVPALPGWTPNPKHHACMPMRVHAVQCLVLPSSCPPCAVPGLPPSSSLIMPTRVRAAQGLLFLERSITGRIHSVDHMQPSLEM